MKTVESLTTLVEMAVSDLTIARQTVKTMEARVMSLNRELFYAMYPQHAVIPGDELLMTQEAIDYKSKLYGADEFNDLKVGDTCKALDVVTPDDSRTYPYEYYSQYVEYDIWNTTFPVKIVQGMRQAWLDAQNSSNLVAQDSV